jgi:predicted RNA binding protein YcfA (HicA-like mRNA interferase family)
MGEFFLAHIVMAGQKHASGVRRQGIALVCIYTLEVRMKVCINTHEFQGHYLRVEGGWLGADRLKHPTKPGRVTVPHPRRDIPTGTFRSIEKQAGLKLK